MHIATIENNNNIVTDFSYNPTPAPLNTRDSQTAETLKAIAYEFQHRRGLYVGKLLKHGIPPHELDDALAELFEQAVRHAATFDPEKAQLDSWLGNAIVRTVASSLYGKRRPRWRKAVSLETPLAAHTDYESGEVFSTDEGEADDVCSLQVLAVNRFMQSLADALTPLEQELLQALGLDGLQVRWAAGQVKQLTKQLNVTPKELTQLRETLRSKAKEQAKIHFNTEAWDTEINKNHSETVH